MGLAQLAQSAPPAHPWTPPADVTATAIYWLGIVSFVALAASILAVIAFGALMILDRDRGEPVSATHPAVRALRIALGVMVISSATSLAAFFA